VFPAIGSMRGAKKFAPRFFIGEEESLGCREALMVRGGSA
jgi:hypothetical protein